MISSQVILEAKRDDGELRLVPMDQARQPTFRFKVLGARGLQSIETVLGFCFPNMTWCPGHAKCMIDDYSVWVHVLMLPLSGTCSIRLDRLDCLGCTGTRAQGVDPFGRMR